MKHVHQINKDVNESGCSSDNLWTDHTQHVCMMDTRNLLSCEPIRIAGQPRGHSGFKGMWKSFGFSDATSAQWTKFYCYPTLTKQNSWCWSYVVPKRQFTTLVWTNTKYRCTAVTQFAKDLKTTRRKTGESSVFPFYDRLYVGVCLLFVLVKSLAWPKFLANVHSIFLKRKVWWF